jgi:hypothetical protein
VHAFHRTPAISELTFICKKKVYTPGTTRHWVVQIQPDFPVLYICFLRILVLSIFYADLKRGKRKYALINPELGAWPRRNETETNHDNRVRVRPLPTMTQTALSDCSYPASTAYNIRDEIDATVTRLKAVINGGASLRKALRALFVKRREEAIEQVRMANLHLGLVNEEEVAFCEDLKQATMIANEVRILNLMELVFSLGTNVYYRSQRAL